jgi:hypothetical protein
VCYKGDMTPEQMSIAGIVAAVVVGLILWKVLKLALKIVLFLVVVGVAAAAVGGYLRYGSVATPVPRTFER